LPIFCGSSSYVSFHFVTFLILISQMDLLGAELNVYNPLFAINRKAFNTTLELSGVEYSRKILLMWVGILEMIYSHLLA